MINEARNSDFKAIVDSLAKVKSYTRADSIRNIGFTSSIDLLKLKSALEKKFSRRLQPFNDSITVESLFEAAVGECVGIAAKTTAPGGQTQVFASSAPNLPRTPASENYSMADIIGVVGVGVDIEDLDNMPITASFKDHDFYSRLFTEKELNYALLKSLPSMHLCGLFAAKEAVKKTFSDLLDLDMSKIAIFHLEGRPTVQLLDEELEGKYKFKISISHSKSSAVAYAFGQKVR